MADKPSKGHKTYMPHSLIGRISPIKQETMYKPTFNKRRVLVFHQFGNKGWSLFSCLGREVVCSVLSVSTLTYASAESVSTNPVTTDSVSVPTAREQMLDEVSVTGSRAPLTRSQAARMVTVLERADIQQAPVQSINDLLKYAVGGVPLARRPTSPSAAALRSKSSSCSTASTAATHRPPTTP